MQRRGGGLVLLQQAEEAECEPQGRRGEPGGSYLIAPVFSMKNKGRKLADWLVRTALTIYLIR